MIESTKNKQSGIAMVQVLIIAAVISVIAISISHSSHFQVEVARQLEQKMRLDVKQKSTADLIYYHLLTGQLPDVPLGETGEINTFGDVFLFNGCDVILHDRSGLLPLSNLGEDVFSRIALQQGLNSEDVEVLAGEIKDWQDRDDDSWVAGDKERDTSLSNLPMANRPFQHPSELALVLGNEHTQLTQFLHQISTVFPAYYFNPEVASEEVLKLYFGPSIGSTIAAVRRDRPGERSVIQRVIGDYDDILIRFSASDSYRMQLTCRLDDVSISELYIFDLKRDSSNPVRILFKGFGF